MRKALKDGAVYFADNGRAICSKCAGMSALYTGCDISGQEVERVTVEDVRYLAQHGIPTGCEMGCTTLSVVVGVDGFPLAVEGDQAVSENRERDLAFTRQWVERPAREEGAIRQLLPRAAVATTTSGRCLHQWGSFVRLVDGVLWERPMSRHMATVDCDRPEEFWNLDRDEWYEVTAPQCQEYLDDVNEAFGTDFQLGDFAGR